MNIKVPEKKNIGNIHS